MILVGRTLNTRYSLDTRQIIVADNHARHRGWLVGGENLTRPPPLWPSIRRWPFSVVRRYIVLKLRFLFFHGGARQSPTRQNSFCFSLLSLMSFFGVPWPVVVVTVVRIGMAVVVLLSFGLLITPQNDIKLPGAHTTHNGGGKNRELLSTAAAWIWRRRAAVTRCVNVRAALITAD